MSEADQRADALLAAQWGVITYSQALECGLTPAQVRARVRSGRWQRAAKMTYLSAAWPPRWERDLMVACLAGPPGTVASHLSAAALLSLLGPPDHPQVTVPRGSSGRLPGATVHRRTVAAEDRTEVSGVPSVRPALMLSDCAEVLGQGALDDLVDDVLFQKLTTREAVEKDMARWGTVGRRGPAKLALSLEVWAPGPHPGSQAEMRMIRRLQRQGSDLPERQVKIFDRDGRFVARIDCGWRGPKVGFEYFGGRHHGPRKQRSDLERLRAIRTCGWRVKVVRKDDLADGGAKLYQWLAARLLEPAAPGGCRAQRLI